MSDLEEVGAFPIGLIFYREELRYILPLNIREDGNMSMEEYLALPLFTWMEIINVARKAHYDRFSR